METIKIGNSGDLVLTLQNKLIAFGFYRGTADGAFGPQTEAAVMEFQKASGLTVDGIVGSESWSLLNQGY
jgi:peptidoglycan hydrolase-like protein with peptidoglycan-binding domain